jgi:uncharacterized membrane protein SpoIIM required for sporulation
MNQATFKSRGEPSWQRFAELLNALERREPCDQAAFPALYRMICRDLALARRRQLDVHLVDRLNRLALRGHRQLYRGKPDSLARFVAFWTDGFPRAVRAEVRFVLFSLLVFYGASIAVFVLIQLRPELVFSVLDPVQVASLEAMYDPASTHALRPEGNASDTAMFGFYIRNNMGVGFRTFASGLFAGVGSLVLLLFNGLFFGAAAGHLTQVGETTPFFSFVIGHGALELQAIVVAGAAGFLLGWPMLSPGPHQRAQALVLAARRAVPLVYGSTGMLLGAALLEAYWSARTEVSPTVKFAVGGALWAATLLYFVLPRRRHEP